MVMARTIVATGGGVSIAIAASVRSPDLAALARAAGWNGAGQITCTINTGVDVASLGIAGIPNDCLTLINRGRLGGVVNGGAGLYTRTRMRIDNLGTMFGGGGMGGSGGNYTIANPNDQNYRANGYGGAGGNGAGFSTSGAVTLYAANSGAAGTSEKLSGPSFGGGLGTAYGGNGGAGGGVGQSGGRGSLGSASGGNYTFLDATQPTDGAAAGAYVDGASYITWLNTGTRQGAAIN